MSAAKVAWMVTVGVCLLGAIVLALDGYTGYAITACAVAGAAAVNLS